jgi:hypothetical protein
MLSQSLLSRTPEPGLVKNIKTLSKLTTNVSKNAYLLLNIAKPLSKDSLILMLLNLNKIKIKLYHKALYTEHKQKATAQSSLKAL